MTAALTGKYYRQNVPVHIVLGQSQALSYEMMR